MNEHAENVESERRPQADRRQQIVQRIDAIHIRIDELKHEHWDDTDLAASDRLAAATHHAAKSRAAAEQAIAAAVDAFRRSAEAHELAAVQHGRAVACGFGDAGHHQQRAEWHREAAATDRQRAAHAQSLILDSARRGQDADQ